jgi:Tfp pilus assembly protein PilN
VRAVNLIPRDSRRGGVSPSLGQLGPAHLLLGVLVVALAFVTVYVLTSNTISQRKSQLASVQQQVAQVQGEVTRLSSYTHFEQLAQQRATTVRQIAATRFDWHGALNDLSKVMPADASLQSLVATASSTSSTGAAGGGGSSGGNVRGAINAPAFELKGCTRTQDEVAQLMSRLRLINGVTRVTLEDSAKQATGQAGAAVATSPGSAGSSAGGCAANGPTFDMVVFFQPLAGAAAGTGAPAANPVSATTPGITK